MAKIISNSIETEIAKLVSEIIEVSADKINPDAEFVEELGIDSMMALEILAAIEKKYKIAIPEERMSELTTLNKVIALTKEFLSSAKK